ncbi:PREDICTED: hemK methyltransferase family member 2-like [Acropora digitifera]|uniref:hemK methyltransferase family member 2-like n=1 Tax=Acropora digitifera TaxID=70779 RepID=UPI00077AF5FB|nr:PREDICTED: hemK methyltransferase family member 2-like [Acropora digitifera]
MAFPTPSFAHLKQEDYENVYEPAEDTFLMMDALEKDADFLKERRPLLCVEVGSGSGALITFLATILGPFSHYIATDINPVAAKCSSQTARHNGFTICCVVTDLVECLIPQILGKVDVLIFNPPYVVTPSEEVGSHNIEASWAGGKDGREVMDRLFTLVNPLLSKSGCFYLVTVAENKPDDIIKLLKAYGLLGEIVLMRKAGRERLSILRFVKENRSNQVS